MQCCSKKLETSYSIMSGPEKENEPRVDPMIMQVKQGLLRGAIRTTVYQTPYIYFLNIPYAAPPVRELRFKDPQPPACWLGIRDKNSNENICCAQITTSKENTRNLIGTEDCLYLNVYKRCFISNGLHPLPVMVWIHGGDFLTGSGSFDDVKPDYLIEQNIVLVSINYRLGALGFLNLNHKTASGNQGLKDQVAALKWVKENISDFGGDPNNITIFGSGMGAVCVHLLMLSPLSKGLFKKAILQSGVAIVNWTLLQDEAIIYAHKLARLLNCQSKNPEKIAAFLRTVPVADIVKIQEIIISVQERHINKPVFTPIIDKYAECPFLPCSYDELLDNGNDIPIILGHNFQEYINLFSGKINRKSYVKKELTYHWKRYLDTERTQRGREQLRKMQIFMESTFSSRRRSCNQDLLKSMSEIFFDYPIQQYTNIRLERNAQPTYLYKFYYTGKQNIFLRNSFRYTHYRDDLTSHGDEIGYLHYMPKYLENTGGEAPKTSSNDYFMMQSLTTMWANFAKTGNPTFSFSGCTTKYNLSQWTPVTNDNYCNLLISNKINHIRM